MEKPNSTKFEKEKSALIALFENESFEEAKKSADQLRQAGYAETLICYSLYNPFQRLPLQKAKEAAHVFKDYKFPCWLAQRQ